MMPVYAACEAHARGCGPDPGQWLERVARRGWSTSRTVRRSEGATDRSSSDLALTYRSTSPARWRSTTR